MRVNSTAFAVIVDDRELRSKRNCMLQALTRMDIRKLSYCMFPSRNFHANFDLSVLQSFDLKLKTYGNENDKINFNDLA